MEYGPARTATSSRRHRVAVALAALGVGWLVASTVFLGVELLLTSGPRWGDALFFTLFIALFAAAGWVVSVLPLALFADHDGRFFRPLTAPVVGAACGVALLLLEYWLFFDVRPWELFEPGTAFGDLYLLMLAAVLGATVWSFYTVWMRRQRGRAADGAGTPARTAPRTPGGTGSP